MSASISWTAPMVKRFTAEYELAEKEKLASFMFEGHEFVTAYAKYLIEYLNTKLI